MARNESLGRFADILAMATPELRPVCKSQRHQIASLHDGFVEVVWPRQRIASYGVGPKKTTEHYAYIAVYGLHVNLGFYHGTSLADPKTLLEGTGKQLRHVTLRDVACTKNAALAALLRRAIAECKRHAAEAYARG